MLDFDTSIIIAKLTHRNHLDIVKTVNKELLVIFLCLLLAFK